MAQSVDFEGLLISNNGICKGLRTIHYSAVQLWIWIGVNDGIYMFRLSTHNMLNVFTFLVFATSFFCIPNAPCMVYLPTFTPEVTLKCR